MPRTSVKGQVLVDLVAKFAELPEEAEMKQHGKDENPVGLISTQDSPSWKYMWMEQRTSGEQE